LNLLSDERVLRVDRTLSLTSILGLE
jgi:hypothetical protein